MFVYSECCSLANSSCSLPSNQFSFIWRAMCPAAEPLCIIDMPFDPLGSAKFRCSIAKKIPNNTVELLTSSELLEVIEVASENIGLPLCMITAFYAPDCIFSALMAPYFNALPRLYPQLRVIAVDATEYSKLNTRYGIGGTPSVIFWLDGVPLARMDAVPSSFTAFTSFLEKWTDLEPVMNASLIESDLSGPLNTDIPVESAWFTWLSWIVFLLSSGYFLSFSKPGQYVWQKISEIARRV
ncbi:hypothetical protein AB6A40_008768 [Gnathostoma spinigerum]|uniref:Thioredoxin domain-containing protein n=1 Tax=Gnathostoma spinigerum TaxID=75299 RepID=A0ABD6EV50_9BILA